MAAKLAYRGCLIIENFGNSTLGSSRDTAQSTLRQLIDKRPFLTRLLILSMVGAACTATSLLDIANSLGTAETILWFTSGVGVVAAVALGAAALPVVALGSGAAFGLLAGPEWSSGTAQALLLRGAAFGLAQAAEVALCAGLLTRWLGPRAAPGGPWTGFAGF